MAWLVGYPREKINWHPTINYDKCVKCGMCMNCGRKVYDWNEEGPIVARPLQCVVGCTTCANLCMGEAISFPDIKELREVYKKEKIWSKVKRQLEEEGTIKSEKQGCC
jgi:NAD-dependent dihydropyrimidine dehydrogenase PreA subunit